VSVTAVYVWFLALLFGFILGMVWLTGSPHWAWLLVVLLFVNLEHTWKGGKDDS
jgi:hypothetical protein